MLMEPKNCACGAEVKRSTDPKSGVVSHYCDAPDCTEQLKAKLEYVAGRSVLEIDDLGPEVIESLVSGGYVLSLADLMEFSNDVAEAIELKGLEAVTKGLVSQGFSSAQIIKVATSAVKSKTRSWDCWLAALDIPNIGKVLAKALAIECRLQSEDLPMLRPTLLTALETKKIEGFGEGRIGEVQTYLTRCAEYFDDQTQRLYAAGVRPTPLIQSEQLADQPLAGYTLCISGEFGEEREKISAKLTRLGAVMKTGVSKKLTHLLVGEGAGRSKLSKASDLNIPKLDKKWLIQTLENNGMKLEATGFQFDEDDDDFA